MPEQPVVSGEELRPRAVEVQWSKLDPTELVEVIDLDENQTFRVKRFLQGEIERAARQLRTYHDSVKTFREAYNEHRDSKHFPWDGASNIAVPMSAPMTNQAVGKVARVLRSMPNPISVRALPGVRAGMAEADLLQGIEDYLNAKIIQDDHYFTSLFETILESTITGTGIAKTFWKKSDRQVRQYTYSGDTPSVSQDTVTDFEGNFIETVRIEDFLLPPEAVPNPNAIQEAHWVGQRYKERWSTIVDKANDGIYEITEEVNLLRGQQDQTDKEDSSTFVDQQDMNHWGEMQGPTEDSANEITLYEIHARFDLNSNEPERECIFVYSFRHDKLISAKFAPAFHGKRPFSVLRYWPLTNSFFGRGIPEQLRHPQQAANDILNAGIDALTLANTGVWVSSKQAGVKPGKNDRIWAGRWLQLDDPESFKRMDMGNPSPNTMDFINAVDRVGQRASGIDDNTSGMSQQGSSRETAEGRMAMQGEANPMFDVILSEVFRFIAENAEIALSNLQQYSPMGDRYLQNSSNGEEVVRFFQVPRDSVVGRYKFKIVASPLSANPEVRKTTLQHLMGTLGPLYEEIMGTLGQISDPGTPDFVIPFIISSVQTKLMLAKQLVQAFQLPGAEDLVPDWNQLWPQLQPMVMQAREAAKQAPAPLDETLARAMKPDWSEMFDDEQLEFMQRTGFKSGERVNLVQTGAGENPASIAPMGGPVPGGAG